MNDDDKVLVEVVLLLALLLCEQVRVRDDESLAVVNDASLSSLECGFVQQPGEPVHLDQGLDVLLVIEPVLSNLELLLSFDMSLAPGRFEEAALAAAEAVVEQGDEQVHPVA